MVQYGQFRKSAIEFDLIQHSPQTDNMLCICFLIIHVSLLQTYVCWQEKEDFEVGPLGFLDKNGKSETLPSLSGQSGWSKKMTLSSHFSFSKWAELLLSTHALPPTLHPITHIHKHRHIPSEACIVCWEINQNLVKFYGTI